MVNMRSLKRYVRPHVKEPWSKTQVAEYYGKAQTFYCAAYKKLHQGLQLSQLAFQNAESLQEKQKVATAELQLWSEYVAERLKDMPAHFQVSKLVEHRLERTWKRVGGRQTLIPAANFLEYFNEFNKHYTGDFPFDQEAILGMIHPVRGHLTRLPGSFHWEQFLHFVKLETLASYERHVGQQLPAKQIGAYNLWTVLDVQKTGHLDFPRFAQLLHALHITVTNFAELTKELEWTTRDLPKELEGMNESKAVLRFELARRLFLERNE